MFSASVSVGDRFLNNKGEIMEVVDYHNYYKVDIIFTETGYKTTVQVPNLKHGRVKDKLKPSVYGIGFIGDGLFDSKHKAHRVWISMLRRCYDKEFHKIQPKYSDCSVCVDWHNFQNFAKWYVSAYPKDGKKYHLDKDIKIKGNRVYSPHSCIFTSQVQNSIEANAKHYSFTNPDNKVIDVYNLSSFCRDNNLHVGHMCSVAKGQLKQHKGWTSADKAKGG